MFKQQFSNNLFDRGIHAKLFTRLLKYSKIHVMQSHHVLQTAQEVTHGHVTPVHVCGHVCLQ